MKAKKDWPNEHEVIKSPQDEGMYLIPCGHVNLTVIASTGLDWDHVSVSLRHRSPTWQEMCHIKNLFWDEDEVVLQYHPKKIDYVNHHPFCLHLWRPQNQSIPVPDLILV